MNIRSERLMKAADTLELPMAILGLVWLALLIVDLAGHMTPLLSALSTFIWIIFIADFLLRLALAEKKTTYLRNNLLVVISIALPGLRVFRFARALRAVRFLGSVRLLRIVTAINRGMRGLRDAFRRRGFTYVAALTLIVALTGAAGMYAFEKQAFTNYWSALWWTSMVLTTMGSSYWPQSAEGRVLCLLLALYAFAMFGYITAILATFFVGHETEGTRKEQARTSDRHKTHLIRLEQKLDSILKKLKDNRID